MAFLAIDIGNTRLKWALYDAPRPGAALLAQRRRVPGEHRQAGGWGLVARCRGPSACWAAPWPRDAVKRRVEEQMEELWDVPAHWVVPSAAEAGIVNGYDHPTRLGADRWVAMIGARHRMLAQARRGPMVVVMVGTAVTVEAVDVHGRFLGGFILPGHGIMLRALEIGTAGLHVPTGDVREFPTNTSDALTSGGTYAIAGAIERMVQHVRRALRRRAGLLHDRRRRLEDGAAHVGAVRTGGKPDLRRPGRLSDREAKRRCAISSRPSKIRLSTSSKCTDMCGAIFQPAPPVMRQAGSAPQCLRTCCTMRSIAPAMA